jgi:hypothetical protein
MAARIRLAAGEAGIASGDPLGPLIEALAELPAELERVADRAERATERLSAAPPMTDKQVNAVAFRMLDATQRLAWTRDIRNALIGAVALFIAFGLGVGADRWWHRDDPAVPIVAGITGGTTRCDPPRPDGGKLCWIPVFEVPPQPKVAR